MQLQTDRLILRHPTAQDAPAYTRIHNQDFVLRYNAMQPVTPARMQERFSREDCARKVFLLEEKSDGRLIGAIFLEDDDLRYGVASGALSYFIDEACSRRGYMKEAMTALIGWLFDRQCLECICCRAFAPNTASRALLKSLGFQENGIIPRCVKGYTGEIFDDVIHTLFREDFHKE